MCVRLLTARDFCGLVIFAIFGENDSSSSLAAHKLQDEAFVF
jgi:hypothetical protein